MQIIKRNHLGVAVWEYEGILIGQSERAYLFEAYFNRTDLLFNGVFLRKGDRFLELYPLSRWFNIFEIHDKDDDSVKAWYCNVTRPVNIEGDSIAYEDLALDLLVYPDRKKLVLDEDEFEELSLPDREVQFAREGLQQLIGIFSKPEPFSMASYNKFI